MFYTRDSNSTLTTSAVYMYWVMYVLSGLPNSMMKISHKKKKSRLQCLGYFNHVLVASELHSFCVCGHVKFKECLQFESGCT